MLKDEFDFDLPPELIAQEPLPERAGARMLVLGQGPAAGPLQDRRIRELPGFLETPPLPSGEESFALGLSRLRATLARRSAAARSRRLRGGS